MRAIAAEVERAAEARTAPEATAPAKPGGSGLDGVGGNQGGESARAHRELAFGAKFTQTIEGAADPFLSRVFARAQGLADFPQGFVLEIAEQNRGAVGFVQRVHGFIEQRFDVRPVGGGVVHVTHLEGDLFARLSPGFAADDIDGRLACDLVKPGGQDGVRVKFGGFGKRGW